MSNNTIIKHLILKHFGFLDPKNSANNILFQSTSATFAGTIKTKGTGTRTIALESTVNAQDLNIDYYDKCYHAPIIQDFVGVRGWSLTGYFIPGHVGWGGPAGIAPPPPPPPGGPWGLGPWGPRGPWVPKGPKGAHGAQGSSKT